MKKAKFYFRDDNAPKPNKPNHIGACVILTYHGKILMEKRVDSDKWSLIGGGLRTDESLEACITREILEETHLHVEEAKLSFWKLYSHPSRIIQYPDGNVVRVITGVYLFEMNEHHQLICSEESRELRYFSYEELIALDIAETHAHILGDYLSVFYPSLNRTISPRDVDTPK